MTPEQVTLLINAGVAGVFAIFAVIIFREFRTFIADQDEQWQKLIRDMQNGNIKAMKALQTEIAKNSKMIIEHDTWERNAFVIPRSKTRK